MKDNIEKLLKIVSENPDLPIVPLVMQNVVADDGYAYWLGSFGTVEVGEYAIFNDQVYVDRDDFKEDYYDYNCDELCEKFNYEPRINEYSVNRGEYTSLELEENNANSDKLELYLNKVSDKYFIKAIIVYITTPDIYETRTKEC